MRLLPLFASLLALLPSAYAATTYEVQVGYEGPKERAMSGVDVPAWYFFKYYPSAITVNVGDTISFVMNAGQTMKEHLIAFNPPVPGPGGLTPYIPVGGPPANFSLAFPPTSLIVLSPAMANNLPGTGIEKLRVNHNSNSSFSSGLYTFFSEVAPGAPLAFNVTFTEAGSFTGYCIPHVDGGMKVAVNVVPAGTPVPFNASTIIANAAAEMAADRNSVHARDRFMGRDDHFLKEVPASWFPTNSPSTVSNSSKQYFVRVGMLSNVAGGYATLSRFIPSEITIRVGDVLHFYAEDADAHTVTITRTDDTTFRSTAQQPGTEIWRDFPSTIGNMSSPYRTTGYAHSGLMLGEFIPGPDFWIKSPFSVQFTAAGDYNVDCLLHEAMGMEGHIKVLPAVESSCAAPASSVVNINFANMFGRP